MLSSVDDETPAVRGQQTSHIARCQPLRVHKAQMGHWIFSSICHIRPSFARMASTICLPGNMRLSLTPPSIAPPRHLNLGNLGIPCVIPKCLWL
jgi:hypothetical protein